MLYKRTKKTLVDSHLHFMGDGAVLLEIATLQGVLYAPRARAGKTPEAKEASSRWLALSSG